MPQPLKMPEEPRRCAQCGKALERKRFRNSLEDFGRFMTRKYCDQTCMARAFERDTISTHRKKARRYMREACDACGGTSHLQVHHLDQNTANNDPSNLTTLCASCHARWHWRNGKRALRKRSVCVVCGQPEHGLGYCQKHRQRFRKYGDPCLTKIRDGSRYVLVRETCSTPNGPE